jgi:hypothetical protein
VNFWTSNDLFVNKLYEHPSFPRDCCTNSKPAAPKIHPLMESEKMKEIWRTAQKRWTHDGDDMVREIEEERDDWDRRMP